jgi:hypothetical protein
LRKSIDNYVAEASDYQAEDKNDKRFEHKALLKGSNMVNFAHGAISLAYAHSSIGVKLLLSLYSPVLRGNEESAIGI